MCIWQGQCNSWTVLCNFVEGATTGAWGVQHDKYNIIMCHRMVLIHLRILPEAMAMHCRIWVRNPKRTFLRIRIAVYMECADDRHWTRTVQSCSGSLWHIECCNMTRLASRSSTTMYKEVDVYISSFFMSGKLSQPRTKPRWTREGVRQPPQDPRYGKACLSVMESEWQ
jgi:hypothetical protein